MLNAIARCFTVLTVVLGVGVMGVSAYGSQVRAQDPLAATSTPVAVEPTPEVDISDWLSQLPAEDGSPTAPTPNDAASQEQEPALHMAPSDVRYAPPEDATTSLAGPSLRDDLSPGRTVWHVPSVRPVPATPGWNDLAVPPDQLAVMQEVSAATGIPWQVFAGIARVESNFGRNMATSSAGAIGYGQFLPDMWAVFGNGGDPYDYRDALPAMGRYLVHAGALDDLVGAVYAYNHSWSYVADVLSLAAAYGYDGLGATQAPEAGPGLIWPVQGPISSYFGPQHPLGIDIDQTATPGAPVLAAHDGVVLFAGGDACCSYGHYVVLVSPSGLITLYAHLDTVAVAAGDAVRQGQPLGSAGCTGHCTGTHVHFEVIAGGVRRNPLDYLPPPQ